MSYYPYYTTMEQQTGNEIKDNSTKYIFIFSIIFVILGVVFLFFYLLLDSPASTDSTDTSDTGQTFGDSGETSNSS